MRELSEMEGSILQSITLFVIFVIPFVLYAPLNLSYPPLTGRDVLFELLLVFYYGVVFYLAVWSLIRGPVEC
jgi:hypothetical protein